METNQPEAPAPVSYTPVDLQLSNDLSNHPVKVAVIEHSRELSSAVLKSRIQAASGDIPAARVMNYRLKIPIRSNQSEKK